MRILTLALVLFVSSSAHALEPIKDTVHQVLYKTEGSFEDVKENIRLSIEGQGLVINYTAQVGGMLERTGKDLGHIDHTYLGGDVMEFCSADLTRKMVAVDPTNLVFCPYAVHLYERVAEPGVIYVGYKRPQSVGSEASQVALKTIDDLLSNIVIEALSW